MTLKTKIFIGLFILFALLIAPLIADLIVVVSVEAAPAAPAATCIIEGWTYIDTNGNGVRETWKGENSVLSYVTIRLSTGQVKLSSSGWYGFSNLPSGNYVVSVDIPDGYRLTSPYRLTVTNCTTKIIDQNFGFQIASGESTTPTPTTTSTPSTTTTPTLTPTVTPLAQPFKGGLAIGGEVTLDVAQRMGVKHVLFYWGTLTNITDALSRGMRPVVGISDCNLTPQRYSQIAQISATHRGLTYMFLNEPDIKSQSGASCGASADPYDAGYDLTYVVRKFVAISGIIWGNDPTARIIYGNEAVAQMAWTIRFKQRYNELYGSFNLNESVLLGTHLYPRWWNGESVNSLAGYQTRLYNAMAQTNGSVIVTELNADKVTDKVNFFWYIDAMLTVEPRVERYFLLSWGDAPLVDSAGNFTALGQAFAQEANR